MVTIQVNMGQITEIIIIITGIKINSMVAHLKEVIIHLITTKPWLSIVDPVVAAIMVPNKVNTRRIIICKSIKLMPQCNNS